MPTLTPTRMLRRSLTHRLARSLSALTALTVSAAIATALLTLYADLDQKLHKEFRSFGANIVITAPALDAATQAKAQSAAGPDALVAAFSYAAATTDRGTPVVVVGTDFTAVKKLDSYWQLPSWPSGPDAALMGQKAAGFIADEHHVTLKFAGQPATFTGAGILKTGGEEDSRIYIPQPAFEAWTGVKPTVLEVQIPGGTKAVEAALTRLHAALPAAQISPVRQLVEGESRIVDRTHALMFGAVLLIALTVAVSVLATLSASVLERRRDFALMKALGGAEWQMTGFFLLEILILAAAGVVAGFLLGSLAALVISKVNFGTISLPRPQLLPVILLLNLAIAALAALIPMRSLRNLQPAALLKGE